MQGALVASGYDVAKCSADVLGDAGKLYKEMTRFVSDAAAEDVRLLYFSGHGVFADNLDWIVPAGTSRDDAMDSPTQRLATDLSATVAKSRVGLVLFIIDACRDEPATKGGAAWGNPQPRAAPREKRFVRFFGCSPDEVCQVLPPTSGEPPVSLFTKALADTLSARTQVSLRGLREAVEEKCKELSSGYSLREQTPGLNYAEHSSETDKILDWKIFDAVGKAALRTLWPAFHPDKLNSIVVLSEYEQKKSAWGLMNLVRQAMLGRNAQSFWKSFVAARNGRKLVAGPRPRSIPEELDQSSIVLSPFSVLEALESDEAFAKALRAVVEADLAVFDVTGFEPGIMLLIGVRSACTRGVTICSHGGTWTEGKKLPTPTPFNLQDLNINSHTPVEFTGRNPVLDRFVHRVRTGFEQLATQPNYLDLPAYDALRQLGSDYEASSTIDIGERVLVLCSYSDKFAQNWLYVSEMLEASLWRKKTVSPAVQRIIDYGTPQLIWQSLYELIRRVAACVVDWSEYNASVFLELGVRLAVSDWGAIQIIDESHLPGAASAPKLEQIEKLHRLLKPVPYRLQDDSPEVFDKLVEDFWQRRASGEVDYNRVHGVVQQVINKIAEAHPPVYERLRRGADALHHPQQDRRAAPQIIFSGSENAKADSERTALEMRVAAWLYLEHRVGAANLQKEPNLHKTYAELGRAAKDGLYGLTNKKESLRPEEYEATRRLAEYIEARLNTNTPQPILVVARDPLAESSPGGAAQDLMGQVKAKQQEAKSFRIKGEALAKDGNQSGAREAFGAGVAVLKDALDLLEPQAKQIKPFATGLDEAAAGVLNEYVETLGARGGMLARLGLLDEALESYSEGATLEEKFGLPGTYNRLNEIKTSLLAGKATLGAQAKKIGELAARIDANLRANKSLNDSGWAWADLGDCLALLGDVDAARRAYTTFIAKAANQSPERTLNVLKDIAAKLKQAGDPDAPRLREAIAALQSGLAGS